METRSKQRDTGLVL